jgi:hypothetical protein
MAEILDLDAFAPSPQPVHFTDAEGKEHSFTLRQIPMRLGLELLAKGELFAAMTSSKVDEEAFRFIVRIISELGKRDDKELTEDFLLDNLSIQAGLMCVQAGMAPILDFLKKNMPGALEGIARSE